MFLENLEKLYFIIPHSTESKIRIKLIVIVTPVALYLQSTSLPPISPKKISEIEILIQLWNGIIMSFLTKRAFIIPRIP